MSNGILYQDNKYQVKFDEKRGYYHLFPIPTIEELDEYYEKTFYGNNYNRQINDSSQVVQENEKEFFTMQYEDILEIIEREGGGKKIIDIGCGYGNFLKFCRTKGFEVLGVDPAQEAIDYIKGMGIKAFKADIENFKDYIKEKYHAAVLLNVLEHLREPREILKVIREYILEDNGLLIMRVPNEFNKLQLIANQEYNLKQWWVSAPQHINYFTISQLENLVANCGYEVILKESTFPLEMFILFGDQYIGNPTLGKAIHQKRVLFEKTLKKYDNEFKRAFFKMLAEKGLGREVTLYARKK